jgi:hypothetical protein
MKQALEGEALMILETPRVARSAFEQHTGWAFKAEGACKGDLCVPFSDQWEVLDARVLVERLGMPLVHDDENGLWCLGPESQGRALASAEARDFVLPDFNGAPFRLSSLRGKKVFLLAWASW